MASWPPNLMRYSSPSALWPWASIVEPAIAASIVWVAVENLVAPAGAGRRRLIAAVFGLVHGLGFASALAELGLARDALGQLAWRWWGPRGSSSGWRSEPWPGKDRSSTFT